MNHPTRKKRSECFLGIHFDFHAGEDNYEIGVYTTAEMIRTILEKVQPDYVQTDCKGHPGYSSYPTKVGNPAPGISADALKIWRQVTAEKGVGLYMHYSGVWDNQAVKHHPEWARIDEDGKPDTRLTSVYGPYVDELLIPQLKELIDDYGVDGVWVDGECWATRNDYAHTVLDAFRAETGIQEVGRFPGEPGFLEFSNFCREGFRRYVRHYVDTLHTHASEFQIASNWAFSSMMPEPVSVNVDYLSGDFTLQDSLNSARLEGRCLALQGKPWDLMAWGFAYKWLPESNLENAPCVKGAIQLMQEASIVLALGGGFQAYFPQKRDGSVRLWEIDVMADVAHFCRAREPYCHRQGMVPQVGLIYPKAAVYAKSPPVLFQPGELLLPMRGILEMLLDSQQVVDIVSEHHLKGRMGDYPLLVLPEWDILEASFQDELLEYVRQGGNLLVIGPAAANLFEDQLGVQFVGEIEQKTWWLESRGRLAGLSHAFFHEVKMKSAVPFGKLYRDNDLTGETETAASLAVYGKGKIAGVYVNLGERYVHARNYTARQFLADLVAELFPHPLVEVYGSHQVDVSLGHKEGKLLINLVNTTGPHGDPDVYSFDEIPAVGPLSVQVRTEKKPVRVTNQPGNCDLPIDYRDGVFHVLLPRLEIYDILEFAFD